MPCDNGDVGRSLAAWWRWTVRPWRAAGLITALIASFAFPAFMAASADLFLVAAADSITRQALADEPDALDVSIVAEGRLAPTAVDDLDRAMRDELADVGRLADPRRIVYADLGLEPIAPDQEAPPVGPTGRLIATEGAVEALDVIEGDRDVDGVWISERVAERFDLPAGTLVSVNGAPIPIAGVFANLWEGDRSPYWDELPAPFVPRFSRVLSGPLVEAMFLPEPVLLGLGIDGLIRWDAELVDPPVTYEELDRHAERTRGIERSYTGSAAMTDALAGLAGVGGPAPILGTDVFDVRDEVDRIVAELEQPIATAATGGIVLGLLVTAAGAAFAVRKEETEVRLLRADGDAAWRFAVRALLRFLAPAAVGAALGVAAAWFVVAVPGDGERPDPGVVDTTAIAIVAVIGLVVAAVITAVASTRVLHTRRSAVAALRPVWLLPVLGLAAAAWIQVGAAGDAAEVDPLVIGFPLVGLAAGVGVVVVAARWLMHRARGSGGSLPPALFLAWRRITAADASAVLLSAALGISVGLIVFSSSLVTGLDTASEAKAITSVGGTTQARIDGRFDTDVPEDSTVVWVLSTRSTIAGRPVTVLAIDPATYAAGVSWHPTFGASPSDVAAAVASPVDADVAAVAAGRLPVPDRAGFGTTTVASYAVVDTVAAAPLTSEVHPTLLVSAPRLDAAARRAHEGQRPDDVEPDDWAAEFRSPLERARAVVISQLDETALGTLLDDDAVEVAEFVTLTERRDLIENRAARWTFDYVSLLAVIAGMAALGTLFFYLSEQRATRELSTVMAERMGLQQRTAAIAAVGEVLGLVTIALVAGTSVGLVVATRVFDRFEPDRRLAPDVGLEAPWALVGTIAATAMVVVALVALVNQWLGSRRTYAEVLRGS